MYQMFFHTHYTFQKDKKLAWCKALYTYIIKGRFQGN